MHIYNRHVDSKYVPQYQRDIICCAYTFMVAAVLGFKVLSMKHQTNELEYEGFLTSCNMYLY